jgi:cytoskeletal protein RodZ
MTRRDPFRHQRHKIVRLLERLNSPVVLVVAVAVFLILDGFLLYRYQQSLRAPEESASNAPIQETTTSPKAETTPTEETTSSPKEEPTPAKETTSSLEEEEDGVRVVVEVAGAGGVGLSILEDGQLAYDQVAGSGFSEEFEAEEVISVSAADAGLVRVEVDGGDPEALGASGEQVTRTFTPES